MSSISNKKRAYVLFLFNMMRGPWVVTRNGSPRALLVLVQEAEQDDLPGRLADL